MNHGIDDSEDDGLNERTHVEEIGRGHGPEAKARADARRNQSEATTPTGLIENAVRMHRELLAQGRAEYERIVASAQELAKEILADAREQRELQRSEQRAIAHTTGELVAAQLSHLQTLSEVTKTLRQPVERAPTTAESLSDTIKHVASIGLPLVFKNPRLLQGAAELWTAGAQGTVEQAPTSTPAAQDAAAEAEFSALRLIDLEALIAELPKEFVAAFAQERGLTSFDDVTIGDVRALFSEVRKRRTGSAKGAASDPGHA